MHAGAGESSPDRIVAEPLPSRRRRWRHDDDGKRRGKGKRLQLRPATVTDRGRAGQELRAVWWH